MFELTDQPIVPRSPDCHAAGGFVTFEGRVRTKNEGHPVEFLEYEAYSELTISEGKTLLKEAKQRFGLDWVYAVHRVGKLKIGEAAVWIGCASAHRKEAFQACEFLIDEMKRRLPIWKKEHYADGPSEWVNLRQEADVACLTRSDLFSRQMIMPEIGAAGQIALGNARIVVVGAGGLASAVLPYLAGAGIGTIGIVEPDLLEASNLHRQTIYSFQDLGRSKARLAAEALRRMHPFVTTQVFEERLGPNNAEQILAGFDIVVDGTDRFDAKFLMNDVCQRLGKPLVQASIYRFDGYVQTILPGGPCLRCLWSEAPVDGCVNTCADAGVLGVVPGFFGILQATEVVKLVLGLGEALGNAQLLVDLRDYSFQTVARSRRLDCQTCSVSDWSPKPVQLDWDVTRDQVRKWSAPFVCVDLREPEEERSPLDLGQREWRHLPMSQFQEALAINPSTRTLLVCASGARSCKLAYRLREANFENVYTLRGGAAL